MAPKGNSNVLAYESPDVELIGKFEKRGYRSIPILYVNGKRVSNDRAVKARSNHTLLFFLRNVMRLPGSKLGCAEGGCGACTVLISKMDKENGLIRHFSVNACLMPVLAADGCHVTTVEGVGTVKGDNLHPIQKAMSEMHGSQCGFCTPGIIVSIYALYASNPSVKYIEEHLDGNLCRCTGYRPIWDAARALCDDAEEVIRGPCGTPCQECPERDECTEDCNLQQKEKLDMCNDIFCTSSKDKVGRKDKLIGDNNDWINQPNSMFPEELRDATSTVNGEISKPLMVVDRTDSRPAGTWFKPTSYIGLLELLKEFGSPEGGGYKIVVGNTEVGIESRFKHAIYSRLISPSDNIKPLFGFDVTASHVLIGACMSLSQIQYKCESLASDSHLARTVIPIHDMLRWFASTQIRNVACLGGNLVTASPISDMNPLLACMGAALIISTLADDSEAVSRRSVRVSEFFLRYRTVNLKATEIVECIEVPLLGKVLDYVIPFKQARRREDDISIVTAGMHIRLAVKDSSYVIDNVALAFGGMAPKTIMAPETEKALLGSEFCKSSFVTATEVLIQELKLPEAVPGGQAAYRVTLAASFLYKFFLTVVKELRKDVEAIQTNPANFPSLALPLPPVPHIDEDELSGSHNFLNVVKPSTSGVQSYPSARVAQGIEEKVLPKVDSATATGSASEVGKALPHMSGALHCTGEAAYTDDIPLPPDALEASLILSTECGAVLESIDIEPALRLPGVVGVYTAKDVAALEGKNILGPIQKDEFVFLPVGEKVQTIGQVLGIVVAETIENAELGSRSIVITYGQEKENIIVTVADAIAASSFFESTRHTIQRGDLSVVESMKTESDSVGVKNGDIVKVSGSFHTGAQEHFYLEPNSTLAVPTESDTNLTIYASTQAPTKTQTFCASATGTPASKVVVRVKRMGGGFGGKETRSVFASCAAAVAAKRSSRPVRLTLPRDVDMSITGTRHVFVSHYHASAKILEGGAKLQALDIQLYNNGGYALDLSGPVMDRALFHVDNCYFFPHLRAQGVACKTTQPPHTAFRGFGGPQGMAAVEHVMEHLACACNVPLEEFRRSNLYKDGDATHFGMTLGTEVSGSWNVPKMWDRLYKDLDIPRRRSEIKEFNSKHKWMKRGLCLMPTKFGIAFTAKYMNQGGSLVHVYTDGTVLVSHGGTEMGQGLHTKVCQVAAQAFGIPTENVYVNDSSTDKVANTIPSAASMSTDLYGMSTLDACRQILSRLAPIREKLGPKASLAEIASEAFMSRIDLSAHGFFALDNSRCGYDFNKSKPDNYSSDRPDNSWKGQPFNYFTQGVGYAEVEIDLLSGNHRVIRSDVIVDVGSSINPSIDIGQIEGAFIQGMGWSTIEEVVYADNDHTWIRPRGKVFTTGPGTYKIPEEFNVSLLENAENPFAVHSSKAIGEPPFFLGASVFFAIRDAIQNAKNASGKASKYFEMRMPLTSERVRLYCKDEITTRVTQQMLEKSESNSTYQPQGSY